MLLLLIGCSTSGVTRFPAEVLESYRRAMADDRCAEAAAIMTEQIRQTPDGYGPYLNRGIAYSHMGDHERARSDYLQARKFGANSAGMWLNYISYLSDRNRGAEAVTEARTFMAQTHNSLASRFACAFALQASGDYVEAQRLLATTSAEFREDDTKAVFAWAAATDIRRYVVILRARIALGLGQVELARNIVAHATALEPEDVDLFLAELEVHARNYDAAIKILQPRVDLEKGWKPGSCRPYYQGYFILGNAYYYSGDLVRARKTYQRGVEINPFFPNVYFNLAETEAAAGDDARAIESLTKAIALDGTLTAPLKRRGEFLLARGSYDAAAKDLGIVVERDPANAEARYKLGYALCNSGQVRAALEQLHAVRGDTVLRKHADELAAACRARLQ